MQTCRRGQRLQPVPALGAPGQHMGRIDGTGEPGLQQHRVDLAALGGEHCVEGRSRQPARIEISPADAQQPDGCGQFGQHHRIRKARPECAGDGLHIAFAGPAAGELGDLMRGESVDSREHPGHRRRGGRCLGIGSDRFGDRPGVLGRIGRGGGCHPVRGRAQLRRRGRQQAHRLRMRAICTIPDRPQQPAGLERLHHLGRGRQRGCRHGRIDTGRTRRPVHRLQGGRVEGFETGGHRGARPGGRGDIAQPGQVGAHEVPAGAGERSEVRIGKLAQPGGEGGQRSHRTQSSTAAAPGPGLGYNGLASRSRPERSRRRWPR